MPDYYDPNDARLVGVAQGFPCTFTCGEINHTANVLYHCARGSGLNADDAADTSQDFVTECLAALKDDKEWSKRCLQYGPYLRVCAEHYVQRKLRHAHSPACIQPLYQAYTYTMDVESAPFRSPGANAPDKHVVRLELRKVIDEAIDRLSPRPREFFVRRRVNGESVASIAQAMDCSESSVSSSLWASRAQIIRHLKNAGYSEAELREYLGEIFRQD